MLRASFGKKSSAFLPQCCCDEIRENDKHEIIVKISEMLGSCPTKICVAESIFEMIKYDIARYVMTHECCCGGIEEKTRIWLDEKSCPEGVEKLESFIKIYLK